PFDTGAGVPEVEAVRDLLGRLVQGVVHFLTVDLAHPVERRISHLFSTFGICLVGVCPADAIGSSGPVITRFAFQGGMRCILPNASRTWSSTAPGRLPERPMGADCKSVGLRLRRFESYTCHRNGPGSSEPGPFCICG